MDDFSRLVCLVGWILRTMEKNKRENNILMYLVREKNGKENWGPKVFSPDSPNCYLPNLKSKWRGKKIPLGDTKLPCATNVHSHFVQFFFFFSRLFLLNCPIFFVLFFLLFFSIILKIHPTKQTSLEKSSISLY